MWKSVVEASIRLFAPLALGAAMAALALVALRRRSPHAAFGFVWLACLLSNITYFLLLALNGRPLWQMRDVAMWIFAFVPMSVIGALIGVSLLERLGGPDHA